MKNAKRLMDSSNVGLVGNLQGARNPGISPEEVSARLRHAEAFPGKKSATTKKKKKDCGCK